MTKIYKKPTHPNRYLNFNSAHSMSQKQELIKSSMTVKFQSGKYNIRNFKDFGSFKKE